MVVGQKWTMYCYYKEGWCLWPGQPVMRYHHSGVVSDVYRRSARAGRGLIIRWWLVSPVELRYTPNIVWRPPKLVWLVLVVSGRVWLVRRCVGVELPLSRIVMCVKYHSLRCVGIKLSSNGIDPRSSVTATGECVLVKCITQSPERW